MPGLDPGAELRPVRQALGDIALEAAVHGPVKAAPFHPLGEAVLARERVLRFVVVLITLAIAEIAHQARRRVEDVLGRHQRSGLARGLGRGAGGAVGGVRFRRRSEIDHRLGQRQLAFRGAEEIVGLLGGKRLGKRRGIGEADVLRGEAHQAAGDIKRVLAAGQHPRQPVERGVGIGRAQGLVKGADQVVMAFARLVVERRAFLHRRDQGPGVEHRSLSVITHRQREQLLRQIVEIAPVAVGHGAHGGAGGVIERHGAAFLRLGAAQQLV